MKPNSLSILIRETIRQVLQEAKFDPRKFNDLYSLKTAAEKYLKFLGSGSSRAVYLLDSKRALKVAANRKGFGQNEAELLLATDPAVEVFYAKIFDYDPKYKWLISELVRPLSSLEEFKELTGVELEFFSIILDSVGKSGNWELAKRAFEEVVSWQQKRPATPVRATRIASLEKQFNSPWLRAIVEAISKTELLNADIAVFDHWGKTPDGRVVLLDYGYTETVYTQYY